MRNIASRAALAAAILALAGRNGAETMADRFGARRTVAAGWLCYGVVYGLVALAAKPWQVWIRLGIYCIYSGPTEGGEKVILYQLSRLDSQRSAFRTFHLITGILALPASLLTGWLWDHHGSGVALGVSAALSLVAAAWLSLRRRQLASPGTL